MTVPIRLTLAPAFGGEIFGAWWPYTTSIARELPALIDALCEPLGKVIDISVNWSALEGVPDLDELSRRAAVPLPHQQPRHHRVMTVTGGLARASLLIVPSDTTKGLAVMVLRCAADLPVQQAHQRTSVYRAAESIVSAARNQRGAGVVG